MANRQQSVDRMIRHMSCFMPISYNDLCLYVEANHWQKNTRKVRKMYNKAKNAKKNKDYDIIEEMVQFVKNVIEE